MMKLESIESILGDPEAKRQFDELAKVYAQVGAAEIKAMLAAEQLATMPDTEPEPIPVPRFIPPTNWGN